MFIHDKLSVLPRLVTLSPACPAPTRMVSTVSGISLSALFLRLENFPPGQHPLHQGPRAQLGRDGQGLVQQGDGLLSVTGLVPLEQGGSSLSSGAWWKLFKEAAR